MTGELPPGLEGDAETEVSWERGESGTLVTVTLGDVTIMIDTTHEAASTVPWLVAALPNVLEAAWAVIEQEEGA